MKTKNKLLKLTLGVLAAIVAVFCAAFFRMNAKAAVAETEQPNTENYSVQNLGDARTHVQTYSSAEVSYSFVDGGKTVASGVVASGTQIDAPEYSNSYTLGGKIYTFKNWVGYTAGMSIDCDTVFTAQYKVTDFHMIAGASIRTDEGSSGIRFVAEFNEDLLNEVSLADNKQFGMLITKLEYYNYAVSGGGDLIEGLNALGEKKYALITQKSENPVKVYRYVDDDNINVTYRINGALTNIKYDHADWKWIGVGVVITEAEDGTLSYMYAVHSTEDNARTASYVASAALSDTDTKFTEAQQTTLKNYVYKTAAYQQGDSEETFNKAENKADYLEGYTLKAGNTLDTSHKYNSKIEGKEAYLTLGESVELSAEVSNADGKVLDVAYLVKSSKTDALQVKDKKIIAMKDGYSTLTLSCGLFGYSETVTVYTGSTDAGNRANARIASNTAASGTESKTRTINGETYYWGQYSKSNGSHMFASYSNISVYYIDYLIDQGYKYLRIPFYFDTTRYAELGGTAEDVKTPWFTIWMAEGLLGSGTSREEIYVPVNENLYYDMDIHHYRMNFVEADGSKVDTYGQKLAASSYYQYLNMKLGGAYCYAYVGEMTFVKESGANIEESGGAVSFGDEVDLTKRYVSDTALTYKVNGEKTSSFTAVKASNKIEISSNIYTAKIGDGSYTVGTRDSWKVAYSKTNSINKTIEVEGGINAENTKLIDVNELETGVAGISIADYTDSAKLEEYGFDVTQTYTKRYSDGAFSEADTLISVSERGLFYVSVVATKGTQTINYEVTLDLYDGTEPVEYESFAHDDSNYAVSAYYALIDNTSTTLTTESSYAFGAYETLKTTFVEGNTFDSTKLYGMDISFENWMHLNKFDNKTVATYGDSSLGEMDDWGSSREALQKVYGYADATSATLKAADFHYLAMDMSLININSPIESYIGMNTALSIYVTPRHSKEYYEIFGKENDTKLKYSYAVPYYKVQRNGSWISDGESSIVYGLVSVDENGKATFAKKQNYSSYWQSGVYLNEKGYTITAATIANNYNMFANRCIPMIVSDRPQGASESITGNGVLKLGALLF